jgi:hypothetical protein
MDSFCCHVFIYQDFLFDNLHGGILMGCALIPLCFSSDLELQEYMQESLVDLK